MRSKTVRCGRNVTVTVELTDKFGFWLCLNQRIEGTHLAPLTPHRARELGEALIAMASEKEKG